MTGRHWGWCLSWMLAALLGSAAGALAQDGQDARPLQDDPDRIPRHEAAVPPRIDALELESLVKDLAAEDAQQRLEASLRLTERSEVRLRDLEQVLERPDLLPEQRQRLLNVAQSRFYTEPRAGLGFETDNQPGERGVGIRNVVAGFPAAAVLQPEDRILAVNGVPLANFVAIRPIIVSHDPGDVLSLTVLRKGETLNLKATLGSFNQLRNSMLDQQVMAAAWELRSRRLRGAIGPPIPSGLGPSDWAGSDAAAAVRVLEVGPRARVTEDGESGVVMGGEPRGDVASSMSGAWRDGAIHLQAPGRELRLQELAEMEQQRVRLMVQRDGVDAALALPDLQGPQRQLLEQRRAEIERAIADLERAGELRRMEQLRRER